MRKVSDDERRARLAVRHALAPAFRVESPEAATRAMTVLHATEPATVYLSCWARVGSLEPADVDRALYVDRTLVKQLAMRRTLFVFPRDLLPAVWASASARVAGSERARMSKDAVKAGLAVDGNDWLDRARAEVLAALADAPDGRSAVEIRRAVPMIDVKVVVSDGQVWSAPRILIHLGATAELDTVPVSLDNGTAGWLLPGDLDEAPDPGPWAALLPVLDPTVMGWKGRDFYLGPHREQLFDRSGNAGATAWVDGRVVGCWRQDDAGVVRVRLLEEVSARARRALDAEAARLTAWLGGVRVPTTYLSPAMNLPA
jgi:hypothetical protein